jgi:4-hydroxy-tetrahydrodipicolinate synthase
VPRFPVEALQGMHAMVYALFDAAEALDRAAMRRQVEISLAAGVQGMAALGLATEVAKLTRAERLAVMEWIAEDTGGRVPLALTIFDVSVAAMTEQARHAVAVGADWVILQPPPAATSSAELRRVFGRVADAVDLPVAIQNAPGFFGRGLGPDEIAELAAQHPNLRLLKGEGPVVEVAALVEATGLPVFNGRGGLELVDNLRAGCRGMILAPDCIDVAVRCSDAFRAGDEAGAEREYARMLPAVVFAMQGIEQLVCYGKRLFAARAGIAVFDRAPALQPTPLGLAIVDRFAGQLGPYR